MIIGVPKECKIGERRVGLTEVGVQQLVAAGHTVHIQTEAGLGSGIADEQYRAVGGSILPGRREVYAAADMIVKVKEPIATEYPLLRRGQILYAYLHLAAAPALTSVLCERQVTAIAYETIQAADGSLPLLAPMSEVAGRMATQIGAYYLQADHGGKGVLLGGATGVASGRVTIIGGGVVGWNAAKIAVGLGAEVTLLDIQRHRLEQVDQAFHGRVRTLFSNQHNIKQSVTQCDLLIGAVLLTGARAPLLVARPMVEAMAPGSVVIDVAVDQGGCIATSRPTSHAQPTYLANGVIHYCVPNIPAAVPQTSTYALTSATLPYALQLAGLGVAAATQDDCLRSGVNVHAGHVTCEPVASALGLHWQPLH